HPGHGLREGMATLSGKASARMAALAVALSCLGAAMGPVGPARAVERGAAAGSPLRAPFPRNQPGLSFDGHGILLFGGDNSGGYYNDTWLLTHTGWVLQAPHDSPKPRAAMGIAYDAARGQVVVFGG